MGLNGGSSSQVLYVGSGKNKQEFIDVVGSEYGQSYTINGGFTLDQALNTSIEDGALELSVEKNISFNEAARRCREIYVGKIDLVVLSREIVVVGNNTKKRGKISEDKPDTLDELTKLGLKRTPIVVVTNGQNSEQLEKVPGFNIVNVSKGGLKKHIQIILAHAKY